MMQKQIFQNILNRLLILMKPLSFAAVASLSPVAHLTEYVAARPRKLGLLKNKIKIKEDFDQLPEDFMEHFE
jgi:hypothetical protein